MATKKATDYTVPKGEENHVHVELEQKNFDPRDGKRLSKPIIQKFDERAWLKVLRYGEAHGYTINKVLHLPKGFKAYVPKEKQEEQTVQKEK